MDYIYKSYKILDSIMRSGAFSNIELNKALKLSDEADKPKITRIVYGVLDNSIKYDYIIGKLCSKKPKASIVTLLKVGMYLLYEMDSVPAYTAINDTVKIAKKISKGALNGFTNGVLRKASAYELQLPSDTIEAISVEFSSPINLVKMLCEQYGEEVTRTILAKKVQFKDYIRVNKLVNSIEQFKTLLTDNGIEFETTCRDNCLLVNLSQLNSKNIDRTSYTVQALASVLACDTLNVMESDEVFDCCSAPGGKSIYMAETAKHVTSADIHEHRLDLIRSYAERISTSNITVVSQDATLLNNDYVDKFDKILCDVPCSGIGVIMNKPDIAFGITYDKIMELAELQSQILTNNAKYLKVGGSLLYSTCTIFNEENDDVVAKFIDNNPSYEVIDIKNIPVGHMVKQYGIQLLPNLSETVGFYMSLIRRKA